MKEEGSTVEYRLPNEYNRWVKLLYCVSMTAFKRRGSAHGKPVVQIQMIQIWYLATYGLLPEVRK